MKLAWLEGIGLALTLVWATMAASQEKPQRPTPPPLDGVKVLRDIPYVEGGHERNRLDLYLPAKAAGALPLIVWIHGGAWQAGSKDGCPAAAFAAKGYAVASVNYRLSQHAVFPAQIEDCKAAIRWLRANAAKYQLDPDHIGVWGASAGGHLVALLGTAAGVKDWEASGGNLDQSSRVQCVVDLFGPSDLATMGGSHSNPGSPESRLIGGLVRDNPEQARKASPLTYVSKDSAPFLILHGDQDNVVPPSQSRVLAEALQKAGVEVKLQIIAGNGHGGPGFNSPENRKLIDDFFTRHLGKARWTVGQPIVTYWAGPTLSDAVAQQMAEGGWNLVWCSEPELDVAQRHGLRAQLQDGLLSPAALDDPAQREKLDALVARVRHHPALYSYFITDEPSAAAFPALGRLVAYLRQQDPSHLAYINLFPTYASNQQLGTKGAPVTAYREHLRQYVETVRPSLISYDHYQFAKDGDNPDYFLNLALIRRTAQDAGVPFLNIVQACTWTPSMRVPTGDEMRYLVYTTLAYGAQGISYYVYCHPGHTGAIALPDGTPTPIYHVLKSLNREFVAVAKELQPLRSLAIYHAGMTPPGAEPLPDKAPFRLDPPLAALAFHPSERARGIVLGYFGEPGKPSHVLVVNLDYQTESVAPLVGPGPLEDYDATTGVWSPVGGPQVALRLPPGGGKLVRLRN